MAASHTSLGGSQSEIALHFFNCGALGKSAKDARFECEYPVKFEILIGKQEFLQLHFSKLEDLITVYNMVNEKLSAEQLEMMKKNKVGIYKGRWLGKETFTFRLSIDQYLELFKKECFKEEKPIITAPNPRLEIYQFPPDICFGVTVARGFHGLIQHQFKTLNQAEQFLKTITPELKDTHQCTVKEENQLFIVKLNEDQYNRLSKFRLGVSNPLLYTTSTIVKSLNLTCDLAKDLVRNAMQQTRGNNPAAAGSDENSIEVESNPLLRKRRI